MQAIIEPVFWVIGFITAFVTGLLAWWQFGEKISKLRKPAINSED